MRGHATTGSLRHTATPTPHTGSDTLSFAGTWRAGRSGGTATDVDPYRGDTLVEIPPASGADLDEVIDWTVQELRAAWHLHVEFGLANPALHALLHREDRAHSPATAAGIAVLEARIHRLAAAGLLRMSEARAVGLVHAAGTGTVLGLLGMPAERACAQSRASFRG